MKCLREKLHSRRGATILLALLFFLVCMLVAASVLMAAVSNAGKLRSNYEQQQKYLALSSALRLVTDQIEKAEYTGTYKSYEWDEKIYGTDENGKQFLIDTIPYFYVEQTQGKFTCGELTDETVKEFSVLDFRPELDGLFAQEFTGGGYQPLTGGDVAPLPSTERTLTVEVGGAEAFTEKFPPVTVKVTMNADRRIHLTATLTEDGGEEGGTGAVYQMEAELYAVGTPKLDYSPGVRLPGTTPKGPPTERTASPKVTWELDWIDRKEAG